MEVEVEVEGEVGGGPAAGTRGRYLIVAIWGSSAGAAKGAPLLHQRAAPLSYRTGGSGDARSIEANRTFAT